MSRKFSLYCLETFRHRRCIFTRILKMKNEKSSLTLSTFKYFSISVCKRNRTWGMEHSVMGAMSYTDHVKMTYLKNFAPLSKCSGDSNKYVLSESVKNKLLTLGLPPLDSGQKIPKVDIILHDKLMNSAVTLSVNDILELCDFMIMNDIRMNYLAKFSFKANYLSNNFDDLSPDLIARLAFFSTLLKRESGFHLTSKDEKKLLERFTKFSLRDIGWICVGCFSSMKEIRNLRLKNLIANMVIDNIDQINEDMLTNILKLLIFSKYSNAAFYNSLGRAMLVNDRILMFTECMFLSHFIHVFSNFRVLHYDAEVLEHIASRFVVLMESENSYVRVKDLERLMLGYGTFCYHPTKVPNFFDKIIDRYRMEQRKKISQDNIKCLADFLHALSFLEIFPYDMISEMFKTKNSLALRDGTLEKCMELQSVSAAVELDCENYRGNRLTSKFLRATLQKWQIISPNLFDMKRELVQTDGLMEIYDSLRALFPDGCLSYRCVVPYISRRDFEIHMDSECSPVPFKPEDFWELCSFQRENSERSHNVTRCVLQVIASNKVFDGNKLHGLYRMKMRHLQKLGYTVVSIFPEERMMLKRQSETERQQSLKQLLQNHVKKKRKPR